MPDPLRFKALLLLSRREYSRAQLGRKLLSLAGNDDDAAQRVNALLDELSKEKTLSDARYAKSRALFRGRQYGNSRLIDELRQAGVDAETISEALADCESETGRCQAVWGKKFGVFPESAAERLKQQNFLRYRGFSQDAIRKVLGGHGDE